MEKLKGAYLQVKRGSCKEEITSSANQSAQPQKSPPTETIAQGEFCTFSILFPITPMANHARDQFPHRNSPPQNQTRKASETLLDNPQYW